MPRGFALALIVLATAAGSAASADETSATDKLRILYSTRFTFTDDGLPLVTVEIMSGQKLARLRARGGITVNASERRRVLSFRSICVSARHRIAFGVRVRR